MTNPLGGYSYEDAKLIHERVLGQRYNQKPLDAARHQTVESKVYYARLTEDLAAATDPLTGYTQAQARIIRYTQPGDGESLDMEDGATTASLITVTNRSESFSGTTGDLVTVLRMGAEWALVVGGISESTVSSSGVCCGCLDNGDIVVDGVETSSVMTVTLGVITQIQTNGRITLPAATHNLTHTGSGVWTKDIGDELIAYYNSGLPATAFSTIDGTITFTKSASGKTKLEVCITGTITEPVPVESFTSGNANGLYTGYLAGYYAAAGTYPSGTWWSGATAGTGLGTGPGTWTGTYADYYNYGYVEGYDYGTALGSADYYQSLGTGSGCGTTIYEWDDIMLAWFEVSNTCTGLCLPPGPPPFVGLFDGQQVTLNCE